MATFAKKTKKRGGLGTPPEPKEIKGNLEAPETFSDAEPSKKKLGRPRSNKTAALTVKLTPDFKEKLRRLAYEENKNISEIIEEAVNFWEEEK